MRGWGIGLDAEAIPAELACLQGGVYLGSDDDPICQILTVFGRCRAC